MNGYDLPSEVHRCRVSKTGLREKSLMEELNEFSYVTN